MIKHYLGAKVLHIIHLTLLVREEKKKKKEKKT